MRMPWSRIASGIVLTLCAFIGCVSDHKATGPKIVNGDYPSEDERRRLLGELRRYYGMRLWDIGSDQVSYLVTILDRLRPRDFDPAYICNMVTIAGRHYTVVVEANRSYRIPSQARMRISILNEGGIEGSFEFSAGYGMMIDGFDVLRGHKNLGDILIVKMGPLDSTARHGFEYYTFEVDKSSGYVTRIALVRLSDNDGKIVPNYYGKPVENMTIGPLPPQRDNQEWMKILETGTTMEVLESLMWLSSVNYAESLGELRQSVRNKGVLSRLAASNDPWVRQSAEFASSTLEKTQ
jgi:hypothetical protein